MQMGPQGKIHEALQKWAAEYGSVFKYFLGRRPCIVITDPDLVRQICVKRFIDYHDRSLPALEMGAACDNHFQNSGILFARGKYWLGIRTACEPLFHSAALASYAPMMNQAIDELLGKMQAAAVSGEGICVSELLKAMSMDVIGTSAFGVEFGAQKEGSGSTLVKAAEAMFTPMGGLPFWAAILSFAVPDLRRVWYRLALLLNPKMINQTVADRRYLWGASQALLDSARKQATEAGATAGGQGPAAANGLRSSGEEGAKVAVESVAFQQAYKTYVAQVPPETSVVSRLKDAVNKQTGKQLSDLDICAQLFTFLLAGYETTSLALSYALYLLAQHPEHQRRIQQASGARGPAEVDALGQRELVYEDLAKLPYTEAAFQESMRLYPPVSSLIALVREAGHGGVDLDLTGGSRRSLATPAAGPTSVFIPGELLPLGCSDNCRVMFNIWTLHRDPRYWEAPEEFRPARFLPDEAASHHPGAYFPFGLGPRRCVGWRFALEEGVLCLARIFQRFELRLDAERHTGPLDLRSSVTLAPPKGIWLKVHGREA
ncbi:hypothetical protein CHLNCDRAFT_134405 [Chlorella variabilis]|uniref:Cytochrome P450 n=1 Tax=Chlorella variabilis TaxID=554065 RepID=E1ZFX5_CHLVA|nr:hypothetical protein CHLNCDRAFT_134405 [Chlorella variabilis]EFN55197.1 hypothetical protein CHLNCDRAFT_134405 [Chlorella variabilis]|eukprot:XP_005847299.1 hypothetical protein CHLNCDRAFT_134405 [Chlorella variabilis]